MQKTLSVLLFIFSLIIGGSLIGIAFGQNMTIALDTVDIHPHHANILGFLTFPAAGIYYSASSFLKKFAKSLSGEKAELNYTKMARTTILGIVVGVVSFVYVAYQGEIIFVDTLHGFLVQTATNIAVILTVDKLVLGGYAKPSSSTAQSITRPS